MTTVKSEFAIGAVRLFDLSGKLEVAKNQVIDSWTPVIRQRMEAAGVSPDKDKAPHAEQVRLVFFDLMVEFFNECPKAMGMLKTMASMKCMGFDTLRGVDHLERLIKTIKWEGLGPQIDYVYKTANELFTSLGYRQRDKNAAQLDREAKKKAKEEAEANGEAAPAGEAVSQEIAPQVPVVEVNPDKPLYVAMCELMRLYGIEPGEGGVNWQAQLAACNDYVEQQAKAQTAPVAA